MAIYSMVKNNTFNGINLPTILLNTEAEGLKLIKQFHYEDFKSRL
jgi:carboxynorspermidine decarboxylase